MKGQHGLLAMSRGALNREQAERRLLAMMTVQTM
jgi:hypothetical protein